MTRVSIIICTCNRADDLRLTLETLGRVDVPADMSVELLVVDNASSDHTPDVARDTRLSNMELRYIREDRRGKCISLNTGLAMAEGDILLFTDDDVRPGPLWIEAMCRPVADGSVDAVAGRIRMAPHLDRTWMTARHQSVLAGRDPGSLVGDLVGANMAFSRRVLDRVPCFDPELGPGALGFGDDSLFALQAWEAGYRLMVGGPDTEVEHHFQESRLARAAFIDSARKRGRSKAYVIYHWYHNEPMHLWLRLLRARAWLLLAQLRSKRAIRRDHIGVDEYLALQRVSFLIYMKELCGQPRQYERRGLVKLSAANVEAACHIPTLPSSGRVTAV